MTWRVRFTDHALEDLDRLYAHLLLHDVALAGRALIAIQKALANIADFPFSSRKADPQNVSLRELLISFGSSGYVALYEIEGSDTITILAVRHQREEDYH